MCSPPSFAPLWVRPKLLLAKTERRTNTRLLRPDPVPACHPSCNGHATTGHTLAIPATFLRDSPLVLKLLAGCRNTPAMRSIATCKTGCLQTGKTMASEPRQPDIHHSVMLAPSGQSATPKRDPFTDASIARNALPSTTTNTSCPGIKSDK